VHGRPRRAKGAVNSYLLPIAVGQHRTRSRTGEALQARQRLFLRICSILERPSAWRRSNSTTRAGSRCRPSSAKSLGWAAATGSRPTWSTAPSCCGPPPRSGAPRGVRMERRLPLPLPPTLRRRLRSPPTPRQPSASLVGRGRRPLSWSLGRSPFRRSASDPEAAEEGRPAAEGRARGPDATPGRRGTGQGRHGVPAGGAPPVPERRGAQARAGAGAQQASRASPARPRRSGRAVRPSARRRTA
jgi:hypothetical protein